MPDPDRRPAGDPRPCPEFVYDGDAALRAEALFIRTQHDPEHQDDNPYERCMHCHYTRHPCDAFDMADQLLGLLDRIAAAEAEAEGIAADALEAEERADL